MKDRASPPDTTAVPSISGTGGEISRDRLAGPSDGRALTGAHKGEGNGYDPYDNSRERPKDPGGVERKRT